MKERTRGCDGCGDKFESTTLHKNRVHEVLKDLTTVTCTIIFGIGEEKKLIVIFFVQIGEHGTPDIARDEADSRFELGGIGDEMDNFVNKSGSCSGISESFDTIGDQISHSCVELVIKSWQGVR